MREDSGIGNLLTLFQFISVTLVGFILQFDFHSFRLTERKIPIEYYLLITFIFFSLSVINNKAFDFEISQPVHMVFRSSSLLSTLLLGLAFFQKQYSRRQIICIFLVSIGIMVVTISEGMRKTHVTVECSNCNGAPLKIDGNNFYSLEGFWNTFSKTGVWIIGLSMLSVALFFSSLLGHIQEYTFKKFNANWKESLFYTHFIGTFYFIFFLKDIEYHFKLCNNSELLKIHPSLPMIPTLWVYLILNCITQVVCILGVYMLTGKAGTLACTLALTVRKFVSLVLSIWFFQNPFTLYHWIGGSLVFGGTMLYSVSPQKITKSKKE